MIYLTSLKYEKYIYGVYLYEEKIIYEFLNAGAAKCWNWYILSDSGMGDVPSAQPS